jgi:glycosyltransferase involved in cell wall biosynthesis
LFRELSNFGTLQKVWIPHKKYQTPPNLKTIKNVEYYFTDYQNFLDRILFRRKINKGIKEFGAFHGLLANSFIHAHTLFSDGALAYEMNRKCGNQYMVTVRSTDLNLFWRYFPHLHNYALRIIENANAIVFLSPAYLTRMNYYLFGQENKRDLDRVHIIPNGIAPYWLSNLPASRKLKESKIKVLFVGEFTRNKNIKTIIKACSILKNRGENLTLRLIGAKKSKDFIYKERGNWIEVLPFCESKIDLSSQYRWADVFVMASFRESFGLVYAEALSQGTPVIFTKGQGFDGWIKDEVCGYAVTPSDATEIADRIMTLKRNHCETECIKIAKMFDWKQIALKYIEIYTERSESRVAGSDS